MTRGTWRREASRKLRTFQVQAIRKAMASISNPSQLLHMLVWEEETRVSSQRSSQRLDRKAGTPWLLPACVRGSAVVTPSRPKSEESAAFLRCEPVDGANGFLVALFEKKERQREGESTERDSGE